MSLHPVDVLPFTRSRPLVGSGPAASILSARKGREFVALRRCQRAMRHGSSPPTVSWSTVYWWMHSEEMKVNMDRQTHLDDQTFGVSVVLVMALNAVVFIGSALAKGSSLEILNPAALLWIQHWPGRGIV